MGIISNIKVSLREIMYVVRIYLTQNTDQRLALLDKVLNLRAAQTAGELTHAEQMDFLKRTLLPGSNH
jgi:hypothetical protein